MRWFSRRRYRPVVPTANPGRGTQVSVELPGPAARAEAFDLIHLLSSSLRAHAIAHELRDSWLALDNGLLLHPQYLALEPRDDGGAKTTTTISVCHERWVPAGLFEYQHAVAADTAEASMREGFETWIQLDLATLSDAVRNEQGECLSINMEVPGTAEAKPSKRQVVLGPTMHYVARPDDDIDAEHPFCPCCLFTNSVEAFRPQLAGNGFLGVRLFASRDAEGVVEADCRINGIDWPPGVEELEKYAQNWPQRGFEFRKQYAVIRPA